MGRKWVELWVVKKVTFRENPPPARFPQVSVISVSPQCQFAMLSYMLPTTTTEEKSSSSTTTSSTVKTTTSTPRSFNLSLNLTEPGPGNPATLDAIDETTSLLVGGGGGGVDDEEEQHPLLDASQGEVGCKNKSAPKTTMALKRWELYIYIGFNCVQRACIYMLVQVWRRPTCDLHITSRGGDVSWMIPPLYG